MKTCRALHCLYAVLLLATASCAAKLPHVDQCSLCYDCLTTVKQVAHKPGLAMAHKARPGIGRLLQRNQQLVWPTIMMHKQITPLSFRLPTKTAKKKTQLPICEKCYGCNTQLSYINGTNTYMNITYSNVQGASPGWVFQADTHGQKAVVKVYCIPIKKVYWVEPQCNIPGVMRKLHVVGAMQRISEDCGFTDMIPKVWVSKVNAIMPDLGYHVRWHGLWMNMVDGISLGNLIRFGVPDNPTKVVEFLEQKLNRSQVVRAALFDLLTGQSDRHLQNMIINQEGQISLIDNDAALLTGYNSFLVPTSKLQFYGWLGEPALMKGKTRKTPVTEIKPAIPMLFDYRCYLPDGKEDIARNYPPQFKRCLAKIASSTVRQVSARYGLKELQASILRNRAEDMLIRGYEWTYKYGEPMNDPDKRYQKQPKCCKLKWENGAYQCADGPWKMAPEPLFAAEISGSQVKAAVP